MSEIKNANGIDWFDGGVQVKLRLTEDAEILRARKRDKSSWQVSKDGQEELVLRHDSREYRFAKGAVMSVPAPVAGGLIRSSACTVGDAPLVDPFAAALEIVSHWTLGQPEPNTKRRPECPECLEQFDTAGLLAEHIIGEHTEVTA